MPEPYAVVDWDEHYENSRTRTMKQMRWVPVRNSHDSDGYAALMEDEDGVEILGAWILILQVASRCEPRGTLLTGYGEPHTAKTIARRTRAPETAIARALSVLSQPPIMWLSGGCEEGVTEWKEEKGTEGTEPAQPPAASASKPKRRKDSPKRALAREIKRHNGAGLVKLEEQITALLSDGHEFDAIRKAGIPVAHPGQAPWDWGKATLAALGGSNGEQTAWDREWNAAVKRQTGGSDGRTS